MTCRESERPGSQDVLQLKTKTQYRKDDTGVHGPLASAFRSHQAWDISRSRNIRAFSVAERLRSQLPSRIEASDFGKTYLTLRRHHESYNVHKERRHGISIEHYGQYSLHGLDLGLSGNQHRFARYIKFCDEKCGGGREPLALVDTPRLCPSLDASSIC